MEVVYGQSREVSSGAAGPETATKRKWGPLFVALMIGVGRLPMAERTLSGALRLALFALYGVTVYLLSRLFSTVAWPWTAAETAWRRTILIVLCLQSSAAIYAIANGMGEIVTAFCVVGHFYCFSQRRYRAAAILMAIGIYFKLYPIVFAFPYFVFSALSREHRRYCRDLAVAGMATAVISLIISGWKFGFFYPLSMIASVMTDADLIPILSREVFSPISVVARAAGSFKVRPVDAQAIAIARTVAPVFSIMLIASTAAAAVWLKRAERTWRDERMRQTALLIFQTVIGFLMMVFSMDVSITLLLPILVSLYAPLWLFPEPLAQPHHRGLATVAGAAFAAGTILVGNLIPLSFVFRIVPLAMLDRMAGNSPVALIDIEKYNWYAIPLVGLGLLAVSFVCSVATIRQRA